MTAPNQPPSQNNPVDGEKATCGVCGKPARHNVPRLGPAGGWVHAHDGSHLCDATYIVGGKVQPIPSAFKQAEPVKTHEVITLCTSLLLRKASAAVCVEEIGGLANKLESQLAAVTAERAEAKALFERHTVAVAAFLNELYAISVDPLADDKTEVSEIKSALLAAASRDRELRDAVAALHQKVAALTKERDERTAAFAAQNAHVGALAKALANATRQNEELKLALEIAKARAIADEAMLDTNGKSLTAALSLVAEMRADKELADLVRASFALSQTDYPPEAEIKWLFELPMRSAQGDCFKKLATLPADQPKQETK